MKHRTAHSRRAPALSPKAPALSRKAPALSPKAPALSPCTVPQGPCTVPQGIKSMSARTLPPPDAPDHPLPLTLPFYLPLHPPLPPVALFPPLALSPTVRRQQDVAGACLDFDAAWSKAPGLRPYLWQRGLALYYQGRYEEGAEQFRRCA